MSENLLTETEMREAAEVFTRVHKAAVALPESAEGIRAYLDTLGVRGEVMHGAGCPIAVHLRGEVGPTVGQADVVATRLGISVDYFGGEPSEENRAYVMITFDPTQAMEKFIENFDDGLYPELIDKRNTPARHHPQPAAA